MFIIWIISYMLILLGGTNVNGMVLTKCCAVVGQSLNISFTYINPKVVTWKKDNAGIFSVDGTSGTCIPIPSNADYNIYCEDGGKKYTLEVKNVAVADKGAIFETEAPPIRNYTMNYFQDPPIPDVVITSTPAAVTNCVQINETMDLMLRCDVNCTNPEPTLKWNLEGKELSGGSSSTYNTGCSSGLNKITSTILTNATHLSNNAVPKNGSFIVTCELSYEVCASSENIFTNTTCVQVINTGSSTPDSSTRVTSSSTIMTKSSSSDTTTPTVPSPTEKHDPDIVLIIIICVVVVVAIFVICIIFCIQRRRIKRKKHKENCQNSETREVMSNCTDNNRRHMSSHKSIATPGAGQANSDRNSSMYNNNKNTAL